MKTTTTSLLLALGIAAAGCAQSGGTSRSTTSTAPAATVGSSTTPHASPSPVTSQTHPAPSPSPSPSPSPTPAPPIPSRFLYVASGTQNAQITTFALDPTTGIPSAPSDTALPSSLVDAGRLVVDPANQLLFVPMTVRGHRTISPVSHAGAVVPIQLANGTLTVGTPVDTGHSNGGGIAVDTSAGILYATGAAVGAPIRSFAGGTSTFAYDRATGALAPTASAFALAGNAAGDVALDPSGAFLFCTNPTNDTVWSFDAQGPLAAVQGAPFTTPAGKPNAANHDAQAIAVHPSGKFVYTGNSDTTISVFSNASGVLTGTQSVTANGSIWGIYDIAIDPSGKFLFSANGIDGSVSAFAIDPTTGALTQVGSALAIPGSEPVDVVVNDSGKFLYVLDANASGVWVVTISPTGALALAQNAAIPLPQGDTLPMHGAVSR